MSCKSETMKSEVNSTRPPETALHTALPQIIAVSIKNVLLLGYGMTLGFPTIVIPSLLPSAGTRSEELVLTLEQISWISSINLICVPLGCVFSGIVTQPLGRKRSMQLLNLPFLAAWLLFHFASKVEHLYMALCLTGLGGGLLEAPVITYVAEITQPHLRGMLSATSSMTVIFGIFSQFLFGTFLSWRTVALINLSVPIFAVLLLFIVPESPHWLVMKNRLEEAKQSLAWLRGWTTVENVELEYKELCQTLGHPKFATIDGVDNPGFESTDADNNKTTKTIDNQPTQSPLVPTMFSKFTSKTFYIPYFLICFTFFVGQFSGMATLQTYAVQIFQTLQTPIDKYYATLILGIVEILGSALCVVAVHYVGKRPLTFLSTIGCGICFIVTATYAYMIDIHYLTFTENSFSNNASAANVSSSQSNLVDASQVSSHWLPTLILIGSAFLSHTGIRLVPWILVGEVYPSDIRALASGLSGGVGYIFGFAANKLFLSMIRTLTLPGTFWFYGAISLFGSVVLYFYLPETEGRSLSDIELHFTGAKEIKRSAGVYKKRKHDLEIARIDTRKSEKTNSDCSESRF